MASRKEQKRSSPQRRLEQERVRAERARRDRRLRMLGGLVIGAVILVGVAVAISSGGGSSSTAPPKPTSVAAHSAAQTVNTLVSGIPQSATRLGSPNAPVTVTEYGDLQCPICKAFALGGESELISKDVRAGKVALVYRSTPTATANGPDPTSFPLSRPPRWPPVSSSEPGTTSFSSTTSRGRGHQLRQQRLPRRPGPADPRPQLLKVECGSTFADPHPAGLKR